MRHKLRELWERQSTNWPDGSSYTLGAGVGLVVGSIWTAATWTPNIAMLVGLVVIAVVVANRAATSQSTDADAEEVA